MSVFDAISCGSCGNNDQNAFVVATREIGGGKVQFFGWRCLHCDHVTPLRERP